MHGLPSTTEEAAQLGESEVPLPTNTLVPVLRYFRIFDIVYVKNNI